MEQDQPPPILCSNNCGFFGSPASMNMCSKCYKDTILKHEPQANGVSSSSIIQIPNPKPPESNQIEANKMMNRCASCKTRVGLTGFECRCGNLFCGAHRYSDKHECPFDYHSAGKDAIERANPVIKAEKLDKI